MFACAWGCLCRGKLWREAVAEASRLAVFLGSWVVPFCPFWLRVPLVKPNSRKKGTVIIKRLLRSLELSLGFLEGRDLRGFCGLGLPRASEAPELRNRPKSIVESIIWFKVYSVIKVFWRLWVYGFGTYKVYGWGFIGLRVKGLTVSSVLGASGS